MGTAQSTLALKTLKELFAVLGTKENGAVDYLVINGSLICQNNSPCIFAL